MATRGKETQTVLGSLQLEHAVTDWIEKLLNQKPFSSNDLEDSLKDGIVLCKLMLVLDNRSIPKYHSSRLMPQHIRENVTFFIEACAEFGVPRHKICFESDITASNKNARNYLRVLETLQFLSKTAVSKGFPIPINLEDSLVLSETDFPSEKVQKMKELLGRINKHKIGNLNALVEDEVNIPSPSSPVVKEVSSSNLRKSTGPTTNQNKPSNANVNANAEQPKATSTPSDSKPSSSRVLKRANTTKAEDGVIENGIVKLQALIRAKVARRGIAKIKRCEAFRDKVAHEILGTEETYVKMLTILEQTYKKPMTEYSEKKKPKTLTAEHLKAIFSDIEIIQKLAEELLHGIRPRVQSWSPSQCLGDIFVKITTFLKVYTNYVQNYDQALEYINTAKKSNRIAEFIEECRVSPENPSQATIDSLLILPVQRIPRYNLLLTELIKYTPSDHKDYANLATARDKMKEVAEYVNEKKRGFENRSKVLQIQSAFDGKAENLIDPTRQFIRSDVVATWTATLDQDKKANELTVTLFNDIIVIATAGPKKGGTMKFQELIKIADVEYQEVRLRQWKMKRNENGKLWPVSGSSSPSPASPTFSSGTSSPSMDFSSASNTPGSSPGSSRRQSVAEGASPSFSTPTSNRNSSRLSGVFGSPRKSVTFSNKNTVELISASKKESKLKICFESPLDAASWVSDFQSAKEVITKIRSFQMERAVTRAESTKEELKAGMINSFATPAGDRMAQYRDKRNKSKTLDKETVARLTQAAAANELP